MPKMPSPFNVITADAKYVKSLLEDGTLTSVDLVDRYLEQIERYDGCLHAMLSIPSRQSLRATASDLDELRKRKILKSPLHGIPVIIKVAQSLACLVSVIDLLRTTLLPIPTWV